MHFLCNFHCHKLFDLLYLDFTSTTMGHLSSSSLTTVGQDVADAHGTGNASANIPIPSFWTSIFDVPQGLFLHHLSLQRSWIRASQHLVPHQRCRQSPLITLWPAMVMAGLFGVLSTQVLFTAATIFAQQYFPSSTDDTPSFVTTSICLGLHLRSSLGTTGICARRDGVIAITPS